MIAGLGYSNVLIRVNQKCVKFVIRTRSNGGKVECKRASLPQIDVATLKNCGQDCRT